jgi:hypothetical protein
MKPANQVWQYRFLDKEQLAIIEAAPSPLPDAIDLAAAISELEGYLSSRARLEWLEFAAHD